MNKKIAVFVSGGGTDLQSIIDAVVDKSLQADIVLVVGSKEGIYALERAKKAGIPTAVFSKKDYSSTEAMFDEIIALLKEKGAEYIVLAGYLTVLTPNIVHAFEKKIINIHPSLIPSYCGDGFYGMRVHRAVVENKEKFSGATVHYVDEGTDTGEIIAQVKVPVMADDTPETLAARVLEEEHILLPETLKKLFNGQE